MAYNELIKSFEKVRAYIRDFYLYGYKSRSEYDAKSARSYDDERRRIESWLGEYIRFYNSDGGKNVFLSVDSREGSRNPFFKAWKSKSFTDGDITLHFIIFDILYKPEISLSLTELIKEIDERLEGFAEPMRFDESTVRKKLKEYCEEGIIVTEKEGRSVRYRRAADTPISGLEDVIDFFSEVVPLGVVGSFIADKLPDYSELFNFKHHYISSSFDSEILAELFDAMHRKSFVEFENHSRRDALKTKVRVLPLRIYISTQNGKQNLLAYKEGTGTIDSFRLDYISRVKILEPSERFDALREKLTELEGYMWGVNCRFNTKRLEHIEFELELEEGEEYIANRLIRERRCGKVTTLDGHRYLFCADIFDTNEILPWIRTFISKIKRMEFSNKTLEDSFRRDILKMYSMYGIEEAGI